MRESEQQPMIDSLDVASQDQEPDTLEEVIEKIPEDEEDQESPEAPEERAQPETVQELLDLWHEEYEIAEGDVKQELAYRIVKLGEAVSAAHLTADEILIKEGGDDGATGFYNRTTNEIALTPLGIGLPANHYKGVLIHEATHAGKITGRPISDEGLTELVTQSHTTEGGEGVYQEERNQTEQTFENIPLQQVIDTYDFDKPGELFELYFATEWKIALNGTLQNAITPELITDSNSRVDFLFGPAEAFAHEKERALIAAAPRLYAKAQAEGFSLGEMHVRCINKYFEGR